MARDFQINGPCLVQVKGSSSSAIGTLQQLGLSDQPIVVSIIDRRLDIQVDAWGQVPPEVQFMNAEALVQMTLVHYDRTILNACVAESMAGANAGAVGTLPVTGARMGNNAARFAATNHYIGLNLTSPVGGLPYRFFYSFLTGPMAEVPVGAERSIVRLNWRVIPYTTDPYGNGAGAGGQALWDNTLDT